MALNSLFCADVPLSNYSLTQMSPDCRVTVHFHAEQLRALRVVAHTPGEPTSTRCYIFIGRLFVLSSTMAVLSMVLCHDPFKDHDWGIS